MSVRVMAAVFDTPLPPNEKILLLALADWASDDGTDIFPSLARMAAKASVSVRTAQRLLQALQQKDYLRQVEVAGYRKPAEYAINLKALGMGDTMTPHSVQKAEKGDTRGTRRVTTGAEKGDTRGVLSVSDPSVGTVSRNGLAMTDEAFIASLRSNPAYEHIDFDRELGKMDAFLLTRPGRQKTRRFIVAWLNRVDRPVNGLPAVRLEPPAPVRPGQGDLTEAIDPHHRRTDVRTR